MAREAAYRFLAAVSGNLPGYEEALRALFAGDEARFESLMAEWPKDVRAYALRLARRRRVEHELRPGLQWRDLGSACNARHSSR